MEIWLICRLYANDTRKVKTRSINQSINKSILLLLTLIYSNTIVILAITIQNTIQWLQEFEDVQPVRLSIYLFLLPLSSLTIADTPGPTYLSYTPDGTKLVTVGLNNAIRVFHTGSDAEPTTIDNCQDANTAVAAAVRLPDSPFVRKLTLDRMISS
jgi:WD40 repeat protein